MNFSSWILLISFFYCSIEQDIYFNNGDNNWGYRNSGEGFTKYFSVKDGKFPVSPEIVPVSDKYDNLAISVVDSDDVNKIAIIKVEGYIESKDYDMYFQPVIKVTDDDGIEASKSFVIKIFVNSNLNNPEIINEDNYVLPSSKSNEQFSHQINSRNGKTPYVYRIINANSHPLLQNVDISNSGILSGKIETPDKNVALIIQVADSSSPTPLTDCKLFWINIGPGTPGIDINKNSTQLDLAIIQVLGGVFVFSGLCLCCIICIFAVIGIGLFLVIILTGNNRTNKGFKEINEEESVNNEDIVLEDNSSQDMIQSPQVQNQQNMMRSSPQIPNQQNMRKKPQIPNQQNMRQSPQIPNQQNMRRSPQVQNQQNMLPVIPNQQNMRRSPQVQNQQNMIQVIPNQQNMRRKPQIPNQQNMRRSPQVQNQQKLIQVIPNQQNMRRNPQIPTKKPNFEKKAPQRPMDTNMKKKHIDDTISAYLNM